MKVGLTHGYFLMEDEKEQQIMRPYPPLGLLCLSAYLKEKGIAVDTFDPTFASRDELLHFFGSGDFGVIGIYTNLMTKISILKLIPQLRKLADAKIVLGGPDVTYNAENYLQYADVLVIGEGEETFQELVRTLEVDGDLRKVNGIAYVDERESIVQTPAREKIKDIDDLPFPDREAIDLRPYLQTWKQYHGASALNVSTQRGCPYTCKWCSTAVYGQSYRRRSPERVVEELEKIKMAYHPDQVWFVDDVFTVSHKWLEQFVKEVNKRNLKMPYECISRADRMNEEVVRMLKDSGCFRIWIGAESGSQKVIDLMDRRVEVEQVRDMITLCKKYGIETGTFIMVGYPGETEADIEATIEHLKIANPDHFTITVAYPIKGTKLYEEVEATLSNGMDWPAHPDRDLDFKRRYSRKYYDYALRRVNNEMNFYKEKTQRGWGKQTALLKMKSVAAKIGMQFSKV